MVTLYLEVLKDVANLQLKNLIQHAVSLIEDYVTTQVHVDFALVHHVAEPPRRPNN